MYADSEAEAREPPRLRDQGRKVNCSEVQECLRNGEKARVGASGEQGSREGWCEGWCARQRPVLRHPRGRTDTAGPETRHLIPRAMLFPPHDDLQAPRSGVLTALYGILPLWVSLFPQKSHSAKRVQRASCGKGYITRICLTLFLP